LEKDFHVAKHTVIQGDCLSSIAEDYGFFWETLWNLPENKKLNQTRKDPNVLLPGDVVVVPDKRKKIEDGVAEQRHRFRKKGVPAMLHLQLLEEDEPRANQSYVLYIDGELLSGTTDCNGMLLCSISPNAREGRLVLSESGDEYLLNLGGIDPITQLSGVQQRMYNLGYDCGPADNLLGPRTQEALRQFQIASRLPETGEPDQETQSLLEQKHGG
jgi:hypothetical protein